jgi:hypothetical protein
MLTQEGAGIRTSDIHLMRSGLQPIDLPLEDKIIIEFVNSCVRPLKYKDIYKELCSLDYNPRLPDKQII